MLYKLDKIGRQCLIILFTQLSLGGRPNALCSIMLVPYLMGYNLQGTTTDVMVVAVSYKIKYRNKLVTEPVVRYYYFITQLIVL